MCADAGARLDGESELLRAAVLADDGVLIVGRQATLLQTIGEVLGSVYEADYVGVPAVEDAPEERFRSLEELEKQLKVLEKQMREAARALEFEKAAELRDRIKRLRQTDLSL